MLVETVIHNNASQEISVQVKTFFYKLAIVNNSALQESIQPLKHKTIGLGKKISCAVEVIEKHFENT